MLQLGRAPPTIQFQKYPKDLSGACAGQITEKMTSACCCYKIVVAHPRDDTLCLSGGALPLRLNGTLLMLERAVRLLFEKGQTLPRFSHLIVDTADTSGCDGVEVEDIAGAMAYHPEWYWWTEEDQEGLDERIIAPSVDPHRVTYYSARAKKSPPFPAYFSAAEYPPGEKWRVIPDFVYWSWQGVYPSTLAELAEGMRNVSRSPPRTGRCGWIGSMNHPQRHFLFERARGLPELLEVHNTYAYHRLTESEKEASRKEQGCRGEGDCKPWPKLSMEEQVERYACLVDVQGEGYSGRLPLLLHSGRPVLVVERAEGVPLDHVWYAPKLVPWEHYIPVSVDLHDLEERARWVQQHGAAAQRIADQARDFADRYLTLGFATQFLAEQLFAAAHEQAWAEAAGFASAHQRLLAGREALRQAEKDVARAQAHGKGRGARRRVAGAMTLLKAQSALRRINASQVQKPPMPW